MVLAAAMAVIALPQMSLGDGAVKQTVHFQTDYLTTFGQSIFVSGNIPELGNGDVRKSLKMYPFNFTGSNLSWKIDVAIPRGVNFTYSFVRRTDALNQWSNPANGTSIAGPFNGSTPAAEPPMRDWRVYVPLSDGASQVSFFTNGGTVNAPLNPVTCRADLELALLAGQFNGRGIDGQVQSTLIDTPLHTIFRRGSQLFNYEPAAGVAANGTILTSVLATSTVPSTRTVGGVTGRGFRVYLPRGYAQQPLKRYPVLYMHDGQNVFNPGGPFGSWRTEEVADSLIQQGKIREMIIVGVDNSPQRAAEYVPELGNVTVTNAMYNSFLINELKPHIDATFRTLTGPADTGVMGSSYGGIASCVLALDHAAVFGRAGPMSPSFQVGVTGSRMASGQVPASVRLYLDCGDTNDGGDATVFTVRDGLINTGRVINGDFYFELGFGHQHNEAAWYARLPFALQAMFPITDEPNGAELLTPLPGDVNVDGAVTAADVAPFVDVLLGVNGACAALLRADLSGDSAANGSDIAPFINALPE